MGFCFSNVADDMCQGSTKMTKVSQRDCCCTGGGFAWGSDCRKCPSYNTGLFFFLVIMQSHFLICCVFICLSGLKNTYQVYISFIRFLSIIFLVDNITSNDSIFFPLAAGKSLCNGNKNSEMFSYSLKFFILFCFVYFFLYKLFSLRNFTFLKLLLPYNC